MCAALKQLRGARGKRLQKVISRTRHLHRILKGQLWTRLLTGGNYKPSGAQRTSNVNCSTVKPSEPLIATCIASNDSCDTSAVIYIHPFCTVPTDCMTARLLKRVW